MNSIKPFESPVKAIKELLGSSYEREYAAMSELCGLIQANRPQKIVKVGGVNSSVSAAILHCIDILQLPCQWYIVDSFDEIFPYTRDVFDLEKEVSRSHLENCHLFLDRTLATCIDEIGDGVDMLILDTAETMPRNLLDFIVAFPYLTMDAAVVLCNTFSNDSPQNILFQSINAGKASTNLDSFLNFQSCIKFAAIDTLSTFQIHTGTQERLPDLFVSLRSQWSYIPRLESLLDYETFIKANYHPRFLNLYREAVIEADPYKKMLKSLLQSLSEKFSHILLYGKGSKGLYFLKLARLLNVTVSGFVVSDGRNAESTYENLPVYAFSEIPFSRSEVFILQTVDSLEVEELLKASEFHWLNLPSLFWQEYEYTNYVNFMTSFYMKKILMNSHIWSKGE